MSRDAGSVALRPKRVLCVFGSLERAGAQLRTLEVCRELRRTGSIEFDFCYLDLGPNELDADVRSLGGSTHVVSIRTPRFLIEFSRFLRRGRYDVIHTEPQFLSGIVVWLAALQRVPVRIVAIHNSIGDAGRQTGSDPVARFVLASRPFMWAMRRLMTRYATDVIAVSKSALDSVLPGRWQSMRDCNVVYNGTDVAPFQVPEDRRGVREEFGWPADSRVIVNIGRMSAQKNHRVILETIRLVHEQDASVRALLIGGGKLYHEVDGLIDQLGLREICAITNNRPDVPRLLLASDVFFFPSSWEGLPGAPLEALAAGLPIVASDIAPIREVATFFPGSILTAPADDVLAHAEHIRSALQMPKDREGVQRRFAASPFSFEEAVGAYRVLYGVDGLERPAGRRASRTPVTSDGVEPKILYTSADASAQSGAFRCLLDMGVEIKNWGYRPLLALPEEPTSASLPEEARTLPLRVLPLPRPRRGRSAAQYAGEILQTAQSAYRLARIIRRERVALVHVNEILDVYGGIAARLAGVPCVWHVRADVSSWPSPLRRVLPRIVAALASEIVAVSDSVHQEVFRTQGIETPKVSVIHDAGPEPAVFHVGVDGTAVRAELGVPPDGFLVVLVSKLVELKGHEVLIRAIPQVLDTFPQARFAIVGGELDGAHHRRYAERLRRLPAELDIGDVVTFTGYRDDVPRIMAAADVIAHCATHPDPFPGVVLQGMALGKAVIATDLGGAREQIEDGVSGALVPPGDPSALAEVICSLLKDPDERASLGRAAACRVIADFTSESFYRQLSHVYRRLIHA
jgi:glycosyltransferase involved in cell wall biosynthesis